MIQLLSVSFATQLPIEQPDVVSEKIKTTSTFVGQTMVTLFEGRLLSPTLTEIKQARLF